MARIASVELVFNAKDNSKGALNSLNKSLEQAEKNAEDGSRAFARFGQSVEKIGSNALPKLQQSFNKAREASSSFLDIAIKGLGILGDGLTTVAGSSVELAKAFLRLNDEIFKTRGFLGGESIGGLLEQQLVASTKAAVSYADAIRTIGSAIKEVVQDTNYQQFGEGIVGAAQKLVRNVTEPASQAFAAVANSAAKAGLSVVSNFYKAFPGAPDEVNKISEAVGKQFEKIRGFAGKVSQSVGSVANQALGAVVNAIPNEALSAITTGLEGIEKAFNFAAKTAGQFGSAVKSGVSSALGSIGTLIDAANTLNQKIFAIPEQLGKGLQGVGGLVRIAAGYDEALQAFNGLKEAAGGFAQSIGNISQQIFFFQSAFQSIGQIALSSPFKLLIGQQVELQQQLLETQSTLVATNAIIDKVSGKQINLPTELGGDPAAAIVSLTGSTTAAIDQLRKDSLELVGVTSRQLAEVFNITTTGLASVGIQSKNILGDAADLTTKFAAALGTIGLPLYQARQEITSILQGTIDQNSVLAKTLKISSEDVKLWKERGDLVDQLNRKLEPFKSGNAIAAKSLSGVTSNLQEVLEVVALQAGKPLLAPLLKDLNGLYQFLSSRQNAFVRFLEPAIKDIDRIRDGIVKAAGAIGQQLGGTLAKIPIGIINALANFVEQFANAVAFSTTVLAPFFNILGGLLDIFANLQNSFGQAVLRLILFGKAIEITAKSLDLFTNLITGVGEFRFVLESLAGGVIAQFTRISKVLPPVSSLLTVIGLNFEQLSTTFPGVIKGLEGALGNFGFMAPFLGKLIPRVASLTLFLAQLGKAVLGLGSAFLKVAAKIQVFIAENKTAAAVVTVLAAAISRALLTVKTALANMNLLEEAAKFDNIITALNTISTTKGKEGIVELAGSFNVLTTQAEKGINKVKGDLESLARGVFTKIAGSATVAALKAAAAFSFWAISIGTAGIALSEFLKRRADSGAEIRQFGLDLEVQAAAINKLSQSNSNSAKSIDEVGSAFNNNGKLAEDFVDKLILIERNFDPKKLKYDTIGDTFESTIQKIGTFAVRAFEFIIAAARLVEVEIEKIAVKAEGLAGRIPFVETNLEKAQKVAKEQLKAQGTPVQEYKQYQGSSFAQSAKRIGKNLPIPIPGLGITVDALDKLLPQQREEAQKILEENRKIYLENAKRGYVDPEMEALYGRDGLKTKEEEALRLVREKAERLFTGKGTSGAETKPEEMVREIIASIEAEDLPGQAKKLTEAYEKNLIPQDDKIKEGGEKISETLANIGVEGKTGATRLSELEKVMTQLTELGNNTLIDPTAIEDAKSQIEDFRKTALKTDGTLLDTSKNGTERYGQALAKLRTQLGLTITQERNVALELQSDTVNRRIGQVDDYIKKLQEYGPASAAKDKALEELFRTKAELEATLKQIQELQQNVDILPDPVTVFTNAIGTGEKTITKETAKIALAQQKQTAAIEGEFTRKRTEGEVALSLDKERELAAINKKAAEDELKVTEKEVTKLIKLRDGLSKFDLERAAEANQQLIGLETKLAQAKIKLYQSTIAVQEKNRQIAERDIAEALKNAQNAIQTQSLSLQQQQQEYDRINKLIEFQGQLLGENQKTLQASADAAVSGLEFLAQTSRSQLQQKELAEAQAAIRLKAVEQQVKFEQISLKFEQEKTKLALNRREIEAQIADINADKAIAEAKANLAKVKLDKEATPADVEAARLGLESALLGKRASQQGLQLVAQERQQLPILQGMEAQRSAMEQQNKLLQATGQYVKSIASPVQQRRAEKAFQEQIVKTQLPQIGIQADTFAEAIRQIKSANDQELRDRGLITGETPNYITQLEALLPTLADVTGVAREQLLSQAARIGVQKGMFVEGSGIPVESTPVEGARFQLQSFQPTILQQAFAPIQGTLGIAAEGLGKATQGFNTLVTELRALASKPTYSVTVNANNKTGAATGSVTANPAPDLDRILTSAKRLAAQGF